VRDPTPVFGTGSEHSTKTTENYDIIDMTLKNT
jgi:hypothetical protein